MQKQVRETRPFQVLLGSFFALEYTMSYFRNTPPPGDLTGSRKTNLTAYVSLFENRVLIVERSAHQQFLDSPDIQNYQFYVLGECGLYSKFV